MHGSMLSASAPMLCLLALVHGDEMLYSRFVTFHITQVHS